MTDELITKHRIFEGLTSVEFRTISELFVEKIISEGASVYLENMPGESLYIIKKGTVQISKMLGEGDERILVVLGPSDYFGELALLDGSPRIATARVIEEVDLLCLRRIDFERFCSMYPHVALKIIRNIVKNFCAKLHDGSQDLKDYFFRTIL